MAIEQGNTVKIEYTGTFDDGTVFDASEKHGKPLEMKAGSGQVIPGFDKAILGMELNEEKEITLQPEEAYGKQNPDLVKKIPREQLPKEKAPEVGMVLMMQTQDNQQIPARIIGVDENHVTIDINHPLAGKTLHFKIKVVEIHQ